MNRRTMNVSLWDVEDTEAAEVKVRDTTVSRVNPSEVEEFCKRYHYIGRAGSALWNWGLWNGMTLLGVVSYNLPTRNACVSVFGPEHYDRVWHMGRLVLAEDAPRNSESRLIGQSLRAIQTEHPETWAVLTYAAQSAGHVGYVYQATNAIYTGLGGDARGFSLVDADGRIYGTTGVNKAQAAARGLTVVPEPRKHRYLYVLGNKTQRRERMKLLRLPTLPYPKEVPSWQPEEADDDR